MRRIGNVRGVDRRRELMDDALRRTVVTVLLKGASFQRTAAVIAAVRDLERRELAPVHGRADLAGDVAVSQTMIPAIVRTQVGSLLLALAGNLLIVVLLFRSLRAGVVTLLPSALAVAWTFGLMGWLGIPLGVATSMFCAVTLGIGVDYGIHFLERFRAAEAAGAARPGQRGERRGRAGDPDRHRWRSRSASACWRSRRCPPTAGSGCSSPSPCRAPAC